MISGDSGTVGFDQLEYGALTAVGTGTSVIPVPTAVWLFGTGVMGLVAFSRRKRVAT